MDFRKVDPLEAKTAHDTLERYSGSPAGNFGSFLLLTNFSHYLRTFSEERNVAIHEGSMFSCAHDKKNDLSIIDFKLGSASAALIIDLCSFLPKVKAVLMLGMCGGLRRHYQVGDYFIPLASIRGEGTSDFYFPPEVPALSNFLMQRAVAEILQKDEVPHHIGITHTTNIRFWEFNEAFRQQLIDNKSQAIEMECATLFAASYRRKLPLGALLLISDLPLMKEGIKTKESAKRIFEERTSQHLDLGVKAIDTMRKMLKHKVKGAFRGKSPLTDI